MSDHQLHIFEEFAEFARTLASAQRLLLLEHIAQGERSVERLAEVSGLSIANASQHLQQLRRAGFVETRRVGKRVLYRLGTGPVIGLLSALRQYADYNRAQVRELVADRLHRPDRLEAISREELLFRMGEGGVTLLDVRPEDEFASGHLPGAINIPIEELELRLAELPAGAEIVAYCRGPYCTLSFEAVTVLRGKGFAVCRLDSGFPDWKAAGLAVESKDPG